MSINDELTPQEVEYAAEHFFPLYDIVQKRMPKGATVEDTLKVMEAVCVLARKQRLEKDIALGFAKQPFLDEE